jgi:hypothetical protein
MKPRYEPTEKPNANGRFQVKKPNSGLKRGSKNTSTGKRNANWTLSRTSSSTAECKILPHLGNRRAFFVDKENWVAYDFCTAFFPKVGEVHPPSVLDL